jgi:hypothetical protein
VHGRGSSKRGAIKSTASEALSLIGSDLSEFTEGAAKVWAITAARVMKMNKMMRFLLNFISADPVTGND